MAALHRAVALAERDHRPVRVGEELDLDVPRPLDVALAEDGSVSESRLGLARSRRQRLGELARLADDAHTSAASARRCLDEERKPDLVRLAGGNDRDARLGGDLLRGDLVAAQPERFGRRADPGQPGRHDRRRKVGVLGEKAVAGVDRVGRDLLRRPDVLLRDEVALDLDQLVRQSARAGSRGRRAPPPPRSRSRARCRCGRSAPRSRRGSPPGAFGSASLRIVFAGDTLPA